MEDESAQKGGVGDDAAQDATLDAAGATEENEPGNENRKQRNQDHEEDSGLKGDAGAEAPAAEEAPEHTAVGQDQEEKDDNTPEGKEEQEISGLAGKKDEDGQQLDPEGDEDDKPEAGSEAAEADAGPDVGEKGAEEEAEDSKELAGEEARDGEEEGHGEEDGELPPEEEGRPEPKPFEVPSFGHASFLHDDRYMPRMGGRGRGRFRCASSAPMQREQQGRLPQKITAFVGSGGVSCGSQTSPTGYTRASTSSWLRTPPLPAWCARALFAVCHPLTTKGFGKSTRNGRSLTFPQHSLTHSLTHSKALLGVCSYNRDVAHQPDRPARWVRAGKQPGDSEQGSGL